MLLAKVGIVEVVGIRSEIIGRFASCSRACSGSVDGMLVGGKEAGVGTKEVEWYTPVLLGPVFIDG